MTYADFAARLRATNVLSDPWIEGEPRFRQEPVVLVDEEKNALNGAAEEIAGVYNEVARICAADPHILDGFFEMSPFQKLMWLASAPAWHGIARADIFRTEGGLQICELNCDTPSGEAEAVLLGPIAREAHPDLEDPNDALLDSFCAMIAAHTMSGEPAIGIVYPTEMTEDLSMIELYRRAFERQGWRVTLGSPYNLGAAPCGRATLFGRECEVLVRHYKTDWWGEREPVWDDADLVPDPAPLTEALDIALRSQVNGRSAIVNPFGAVLPQNKRAMAFMWEERDRFPAWARDAIARLVPYTCRLETMAREDLLREKDEWVIKSDYGCEGAEVIVGASTPEDEWRHALEHARRGRWIAQRRFVPLVETGAGEAINYGVYLVAGEACGILSRLSKGPTDRFARTAATLVARAR